MKKLLSVFIIFSVFFVFVGCEIPFIGDDDDVLIPDVGDDVDDEVDDDVDDEEEDDDVDDEEEDDDVDDEEDKDDEIAELEKKLEELEKKIEEQEKDPEPTSTGYTGPNYLTLNSPAEGASFTECPIVFKGSVSPNTTKVVATATGAYDYRDVYALQQFNYGDDYFVYRAKVEWENLAPGTNNYTFTAYFDDGTTKSTSVSIFYTFNTVEMGKPVIYLYPEKTMKVFVDVEPQDGVSVSEPELGDGWTVMATPDSKIYNFADGEVYPYLFWEGFSSDLKTPEEGFVVSVEEVDSFFDDKLSVLGLTEGETADFKEFWVPRLSEDPYYFITFVPQEEFDKYAPLTVYPEPDSVIRVFFDYEGLEDEVAVVEQKLETPIREGFSVVEWGGRLYR